jgi:hypothetical protein
MAVNPMSKRVSCAYPSRTGTIYAVNTTVGRATAAELGGAPAGTPSYPKGWKPAHVNLEATDGSGQKCSLVSPEPMVIGSTVTVPPLGNFVVTGWTGEQIHRQAPAFA